MAKITNYTLVIIKYIPLQQGLRPFLQDSQKPSCRRIIKYIPLQQGLRQRTMRCIGFLLIIKYIPLQQGLRH